VITSEPRESASALPASGGRRRGSRLSVPCCDVSGARAQGGVDARCYRFADTVGRKGIRGVSVVTALFADTVGRRGIKVEEVERRE
jgi:hypothetical protein